jgi:hypothetical protein
VGIKFAHAAKESRGVAGTDLPSGGDVVVSGKPKLKNRCLATFATIVLKN